MTVVASKDYRGPYCDFFCSKLVKLRGSHFFFMYFLNCRLCLKLRFNKWMCIVNIQETCFKTCTFFFVWEHRTTYSC